MAMEEGNIANWSQDQLHPLLNSVVLKQVFDYLKPSASLDTLKSVRQVCTVWRDESLGWWRETAVLTLTPEIMEDPELTVITQLLEQKPFYKYKLKDTTINMAQVFEEGTQVNRFWTTVGPHVKHLIFKGVAIRVSGFPGPVQEKVSVFIYFLIDKFPNMSTLDIQKTLFWDVAPRRILLNVIDKKRIFELEHPSVRSLRFDYPMTCFALSNFPKLQHLRLGSCLSFLRMLRNGQISNKDPILHSNLKDLDLNLDELFGFNYNEEMETLDLSRHIKLPALERLSVDFGKGWRSSGSRIFPVLLRNHWEKMKILEVSCRPDVYPYSNFPFDCQLDQLTELRLWGNVVKDLSFLKWTPKLKVLHMDPYGLERRNVPKPMEKRNMIMHPVMHDILEAAVRKGGMEGVVLQDLEYLHINCEPFSLQSLETLGEWMPNVKNLGMVLGQESVGVILSQWPLLEHLVAAHGSVLEDEDIIGKSGENPEKKGLVDFTELKTFHLNAACGQGRLTDLAAYSGFMKISKLTDLQICVSDKFTLETEGILKDRILNVVVIRNYFGNEEHKNWICCKNAVLMDFLGESSFDRSDGSSESDEDEFNDDGWNDNYDALSNDELLDEGGTDSEDEDDEEEEEGEEAEHSNDEEKEKSDDEANDSGRDDTNDRMMRE